MVLQKQKSKKCRPDSYIYDVFDLIDGLIVICRIHGYFLSCFVRNFASHFSYHSIKRWGKQLSLNKFHCIQFMITLIIISFSSGLDSAIIIVRATNVESSIFFLPSSNRARFLSKKYKNIVAAILLFPSKKL